MTPEPRESIKAWYADSDEGTVNLTTALVDAKGVCWLPEEGVTTDLNFLVFKDEGEALNKCIEITTQHLLALEQKVDKLTKALRTLKSRRSAL